MLIHYIVLYLISQTLSNKTCGICSVVPMTQMNNLLLPVRTSSLQCYSILSDIWVKIELCIPLESESSVLSTCNAFVCLPPPSKLKFAVLFCSICKGLISFSAILF